MFSIIHDILNNEVITMKQVFSIISTLILVWAIFIGIEYVRSYRGDEKMIVTIDTETTNDYTKRTGLGFSIIDYNVKTSSIKNGTVLKEFYIFGIRVGKTVAEVKHFQQ